MSISEKCVLGLKVINKAHVEKCLCYVTPENISRGRNSAMKSIHIVNKTTHYAYIGLSNNSRTFSRFQLIRPYLRYAFTIINRIYTLYITVIFILCSFCFKLTPLGTGVFAALCDEMFLPGVVAIFHSDQAQRTIKAVIWWRAIIRTCFPRGELTRSDCQT